ALSRILPLECETLSSAITKAFKARKIDVVTGALVSSIQTGILGVTINLKDGKKIDADMALVAIGRACNTAAIGLENAGITTDKMGMIAVDGSMQTSVPGIYAIGDITGKAMYAHVATHQGI